MLKFQLLFPTTRTQTLSKSINHCKQRTSVAGTTKQEAGSRKTKTFAVSAESDKRTAWEAGFHLVPTSPQAVGTARALPSSWHPSPTIRSTASSSSPPFLSTILQMLADPPRNWTQEPSFPPRLLVSQDKISGIWGDFRPPERERERDRERERETGRE